MSVEVGNEVIDYVWRARLVTGRVVRVVNAHADGIEVGIRFDTDGQWIIIWMPMSEVAELITKPKAPSVEGE